MTGGINSFKDKIMFEIYKSNDYTNEYRVVYFSELDDHNRDKEIDRAMKGDHYFDGFIFTLKKGLNLIKSKCRFDPIAGFKLLKRNFYKLSVGI